MAKGNVTTTEASKLKTWWDNGREYLSAVIAELKKVHWPGRNQLIGYTGIVLFSITLVALIIWLFDSGLSFLLQKLMQAFA